MDWLGQAWHLIDGSHPLVNVSFGLVWIVGTTVARRRRGAHFFMPTFVDRRFLETRRSGRSLRNWLTRVGGARNCLWVVVTADRVRVGAHFPFSTMYLPEIYGLDLDVPATAVRSVEIRRRWVRIVADVGDRSERFELAPADAAGFAAAVAAAGGPVATAT